MAEAVGPFDDMTTADWLALYSYTTSKGIEDVPVQDRPLVAKLAARFSCVELADALLNASRIISQLEKAHAHLSLVTGLETFN